MSEPSPTTGEGDHKVNLEVPRDGKFAAHDRELAECTGLGDEKATSQAKRTDTKDPSITNIAQDTPPSPAAKPRSKSYTDLEKQKMDCLIAKNKELASKQADISQKHSDILGSLKTRDPKALVGRHISLLHEYNEIRDSGQKLLAMIAEERGVTAKEVYEEFGVGESD